MMHKIPGPILAISLVIVLSGCAAPARLSEDAAALRATMTAGEASRILSTYVMADESRGGLCLIGFNPGATLDYSAEISVRGSTILFTGLFGEGQFFGKTFLPDTQVEALKPKVEAKEVRVDASGLREIRVLSRNVENTKTWCPNVKPSYLVVMKPHDGLPADAELAINVARTAELDRLLAALTHLSPGARLVGGTGM